MTAGAGTIWISKLIPIKNENMTLNQDLQNKLVDRFLSYVAIDTRSDPASLTVPSTAAQLKLARLLEKEMKEIGFADVSVDDKGYLFGKLPGNAPSEVPKIGFIAHMDTAPDFVADKVNPLIWKDYDGKDLILNENEEKNIIMEVETFPELKNYIGNTLITTDGTTLLGADDKAGIAVILTAMEFLVQHPEIKRGDLRIGFTPDEEICRGADHFDVEKFDADFAYTIDGGEIGKLQYENFNAAQAKIAINGRNIHPGSAKNKMKNALLIGIDFASMLPEAETPGHTDDYEGFFHLTDFNGTVEQAEMVYIIRDHDMEQFERRKLLLGAAAKYGNEKYGEGSLMLDIKDQYFNMKEQVEPVLHIVDNAQKAMEAVGITPKIIPIRGGTDGSRLSYMGLPTPNLFMGGHNYHGRFEYIPVESMIKSVKTVIKITEIYAEKKATT